MISRACGNPDLFEYIEVSRVIYARLQFVNLERGITNGGMNL